MVKNHHPDCSITIQIDFRHICHGPAGGVETGEAGIAGMPPISAGEFPTERGRSVPGNPELGPAGAEVS